MESMESMDVYISARLLRKLLTCLTSYQYLVLGGLQVRRIYANMCQQALLTIHALSLLALNLYPCRTSVRPFVPLSTYKVPMAAGQETMNRYEWAQLRAAMRCWSLSLAGSKH